ncbi:MAG: hypothetical protein RsTaC01_0012 [Candidatus Paraimprobicoccus trichonymphae]|uniref:Lipoprotein n=1 Tax=Candidatus Paraimprobicoccus trichonymphae TaxID=3033793 RepID=A0AA48HVV4_9FIRM|nr:MAG: hypothetical protein RsTaC01_0012 [Candidatus Paraimprobicoccus trichonymphae]
MKRLLHFKSMILSSMLLFGCALNFFAENKPYLLMNEEFVSLIVSENGDKIPQNRIWTLTKDTVNISKVFYGLLVDPLWKFNGFEHGFEHCCSWVGFKGYHFDLSSAISVGLGLLDCYFLYDDLKDIRFDQKQIISTLKI